MTAAVKKGPLSSEKYRAALAKNHRLTRAEGIDTVMKKHRLDAIIVPTGGPAWLIDLANGDAINWDMESSSPPAVAGYPHITVPAGYIFGLPVGLSFIARAWQEPTLLKLAYAFEQAARVRKPPQFKPTAEFQA
jgi:amidase